MTEKILYINMGIPGSGKSTKAKTLAPENQIFATDDYWINDLGEYKFDFNRLAQSHKWNQRRVLKALEDGLTPIVVDNTNLTPKERKPYVDMAIKHGYEVVIVHPDSPWFKEIYPRILDKTYTDDDARVFFEKNVHNVPFEVIKNMMAKWKED